MTKRENADLEMMLALKLYCEERSELFAEKAFFKDPYTAFKANIDLIQGFAVNQGTATQSATESKRAKRTALEDIAKRMLTALKVYATQAKNKDLLHSFPYIPSDYDIMPDSRLHSETTRLYDLLRNEVIGNLADFGILPGMLADLRNLNTEFGNMIGAPHKLRALRTDATKDIKDSFAKNRELLEEQMDPAAMALAYIDADFAQGYFTVRKRDDPAYRKLSYNIQVVEAGSGNPLSKANVLLKPWNEEKKTGEKGSIRGHLTEGSGTVTIRQKGYAEQSLPLHINDGLTTELLVVMVKG